MALFLLSDQIREVIVGSYHHHQTNPAKHFCLFLCPVLISYVPLFAIPEWTHVFY
jgi:hypothetical protein